MTEQLTEQRIEGLSMAERGMLIRDLAEIHPRIASRLLGQIDLYREREKVREAMPVHPFTEHADIPGLQLCYLRSEGVTCLRPADHPLHAL